MLTSGGLDSAILLADLARTRTAYPIYVRAGMAWEDAEVAALPAYVAALGNPNVQPLTVLQAPFAPLYGNHWSITGRGTPGADTPDHAVFLPGRNILLIGLAAVWCSLHHVRDIAIGSLGDNPFPDASPQFFDEFARVVGTGLGHPVQVLAPYRGLHKDAIIARNPDLPLELTITCIAPALGVHCGACNKCHERQIAFAASGVPDRTRYAARKE